MPPVTLYNAATGAVLAKAGLGDGYRGKAFLDEVSQLLMEGAVSPGLGTSGPLVGYGREANYPTFIKGDQLTTNPIGAATPITSSYVGTTLYKVVRNSFVLGTGTGAAVLFGDVAPTTAARNAANYAGAGAGDGYTPTPAGCTAAARATAAGGTYNLATTSISFSVIVNGITYAITGTASNGAAVTDTEVVDAINNSLPATSGAHALLCASTGYARILTIEEGKWNTLQIVAGTQANIIFAASGALGTTVYGAGGPLNQVGRQAVGAKVQRRILPGSITVTGTVSSATVTGVDSTYGHIVGTGFTTATSTINYATGAVHVVFGTAPDNSTSVNVAFGCLIPVDLTEKVQIPPRGLDLAILTN
jgi:hypothetical protein